MKTNTKENLLTLSGILIVLFVVVSWITHLVVCFKTASWGFLIAGAIFFPIGIIHGAGSIVGIW